MFECWYLGEKKAHAYCWVYDTLLTPREISVWAGRFLFFNAPPNWKARPLSIENWCTLHAWPLTHQNKAHWFLFTHAVGAVCLHALLIFATEHTFEATELMFLSQLVQWYKTKTTLRKRWPTWKYWNHFLLKIIEFSDNERIMLMFNRLLVCGLLTLTLLVLELILWNVSHCLTLLCVANQVWSWSLSLVTGSSRPLCCK